MIIWHCAIASFQSTLPSRGATRVDVRSMREIFISIHAPLAGSDSDSRWNLCGLRDFNPRSPRGERRIILQLESDL